MKNVIRFWLGLIGSAVLLFGAGAAQAADRGTDSWSGVYIGAVGGVQWTRSHFALPGDQADALLSSHDTRSNWFAGGDIGANYQTGNVVLGLEADLVGENAKQAVTACTVPDGCWVPTHDSFTTLNHLKERLVGHLRARAGLASGGNLFYVAGGYSVAKTRLDLIGECFNPGDPNTPLLFNYSRKRTISGFNLGAGVERRLARHISLRAEYVFDYGHQLYRGDGTEWNDRRIAVRNSSVRLGVSVLF
ncbi:MAG TPA: outer membrane beta-barrel protein [Allosphingosinicella sp.]|jgi:opacity protein-like surface antigen|nr:outer membrane beta-barrel protein [Allosphingosinicella sp.]